MLPADHKIAVFASGTGSNATKIVEHFSNQPDIEVALIISNNKEAPVLEMANKNNIPTLLLQRRSFYDTTDLLTQLYAAGVNWIALAGFLWLIPPYLIRAFAERIINIHPALLPEFGGKGMYGGHVHEAVKAAKKEQSGPTIHYVNENYDEGAYIFQASCRIEPTDNAKEIAAKVLKLEHKYFPLVLESLIRNSDQQPKTDLR
ncbi:MAG: phosphoribosylglycinamide formyltransferase [Bacteroidetes bacterium]|nr:phosphoribosylglycinamide formyltransferase [Bacteroidota bacterium]